MGQECCGEKSTSKVPTVSSSTSLKPKEGTPGAAKGGGASLHPVIEGQSQSRYKLELGPAPKIRVNERKILAAIQEKATLRQEVAQIGRSTTMGCSGKKDGAKTTSLVTPASVTPASSAGNGRAHSKEAKK